jgi:hypothetical protein
VSVAKAYYNIVVVYKQLQGTASSINEVSEKNISVIDSTNRIK